MHKVRGSLNWMEGEWVWVGSELESQLRLKAEEAWREPPRQVYFNIASFQGLKDFEF